MLIQICLTNNQPIFEDGIRSIIEHDANLRLIKCLEAHEKPLTLIQGKKPDIVLFDLTYCEEHCLAAVKQISENLQFAKCIVIIAYAQEKLISTLLDEGVKGVLLKENISELLVPVIYKVIQGEIYIPPFAKTRLTNEHNHSAKRDTNHLTILLTKLHPPQVYSDQIIRTSLINQLEENLEKPVSLISAPAGYGKSQTVGQWIYQTSTKSCWISLDNEHNNLRTFLTYLVKAFDKMIPGSAEQTALLVSAKDLPPLNTIAFTLINELDEIQENFILVLDDYHRIKEKSIHALIDKVLAYPPQKMHISILTRLDPPLKLNSMLAKGRMIEIRMRELAFSQSEIIALYDKLLNISLSKQTAKSLKEKTEGWIVALRMTSFLIKDNNDAEEVLASFRGDIYSLTKYLLEEILIKQSSAYQSLLLNVSILDRFSVELIDQFIDQAEIENVDGQDFINWLLHSNLFIIPLDLEGNWYRFHHLIQEFLYSLFKNKYSPEYIHSFHKKASMWFEGHGYIDEAIEHMLKAEDPDSACGIIEQHREKELDLDRWYILEQWLDKLPSEAKQRPALLLSTAWAAYENFQLHNLPTILEQTAPLLTDSKSDEALWGEWHLMWGLLLHWSGDGKAALDHFSKAKALLPNKESLATGMLYLHIGLARGVTGQFDLAISDLNKQLAASKGDATFVTRIVAGLHYNYQFAGDTKKSRIEGKNSQIIAMKHGIIYTEAMAICQEATACFCAHQLPETLALCEKAHDHRFIIHRQTAIDAMIAKVIAHELSGQAEEADKSLVALENFFNEINEPAHYVYLDSCRARLGVLRGNIDSSSSWIHTFEMEPSFAALFVWVEVPLITQARALIALGTSKNLKKAGEILYKVKQTARSFSLMNQEIEILVLEAILLYKQGDGERSKNVLHEVLKLAEPRQFIRPFIEAGNELKAMLTTIDIDSGTKFIDLLNSNLEKITPTQVMRTSVDKNEQSRGVTIGQPNSGDTMLSIREQEIVKLLAEGFRNKEIADKLYVSEGTVKKHVYNIGQKWSVHNRINIIQKARELKYL